MPVIRTYLGDILIWGTAPDSSVDSSYITFADASVAAICIANFDTNNDGSISYAEAAAVTTITKSYYASESYFTDSSIQTFDEFQYFTGLTSIVEFAFYNCDRLTSIIIPNSVTSIGRRAFDSCNSLTSINIPNSVTSIGSEAFFYCNSLTSVTIPNGVTSIGYQTFCSCTSLQSVTIPNSVTSIGENAFFGCDLRSITIPSSVTSIGNGAFAHCDSLISITIENSVPPSIINSGDFKLFAYCSSLTSIYVPAASVETYKSASGWSEYASQIQAIPS